MSPLPLLALNLDPLPKLVGPVKPRLDVYCRIRPRRIIPSLALIRGPALPGPTEVSPVRLIGPIPFATILDPTCNWLAEHTVKAPSNDQQTG